MPIFQACTSFVTERSWVTGAIFGLHLSAPLRHRTFGCPRPLLTSPRWWGAGTWLQGKQKQRNGTRKKNLVFNIVFIVGMSTAQEQGETNGLLEERRCFLFGKPDDVAAPGGSRSLYPWRWWCWGGRSREAGKRGVVQGVRMALAHLSHRHGPQIVSAGWLRPSKKKKAFGVRFLRNPCAGVMSHREHMDTETVGFSLVRGLVGPMARLSHPATH